MNFESAKILWLTNEQCASILSKAQDEARKSMTESERKISDRNLAEILAFLCEKLAFPLQEEHPNLLPDYLGGPNKVDRNMINEVADICSEKRKKSI